MPDLILIYGPPASGKATVGRELSKITSYKLLHTDMESEYVSNFFDLRTKDFNFLTSKIKFLTLEYLSNSDLDGLIFTYVHNFNNINMEMTKILISKFRRSGGEIYIIELFANQETRLERNSNEDRIRNKFTKGNISESNNLLLSMDKTMIMNSCNKADNYFTSFNYMKIDTSMLDIDSTIKNICKHFDNFKN